MSNAVQETGGYLPVHIDQGGYIYCLDANGQRGRMVHRETRNMHRVCCSTFSEAVDHMLTCEKESMRDAYGATVGVLELTPDGGGQAIWVPTPSLKEWDSRLKFWKGCYGAWPLRPIQAT